MNDIHTKKFIVGENDIFDALRHTQPKQLYDQFDYNIMIPDEYIEKAHLYYLITANFLYPY
jgi:hypothetical protein